ncbi:MAG: polyamine aminopropyltransferase [Myxococcota bacterium]
MVEPAPPAETAPPVDTPDPGLRAPLLLLSVLVVATCGLVYELLAGTLASYLLGDSVLQFSTVIGVYLCSMGIGAWVSRFVERGVSRRFVEVELAVALVGGTLAPILFFSFTHSSVFRLALYGLVTLTGILVGLEVPLLLRILKSSMSFKDVVARVLTVDYLGALVASVAFPVVFLPRLGLIRTGLLFGLLNALVGLASTWMLGRTLGNPTSLRVKSVVVCLLLGALLWKADVMTELSESSMYADEVVYAKQTAYQRIVVTRARHSIQLFLNGALQFSSVDEYRYHEALVHPAFSVGRNIRNVLVLGGGDGLAVRDILRHPSVESVTLVDLDKGMTDLARDATWLKEQNQGALSDPRVTVIHADAMIWLEERQGPPFDLAIVDFPDPSSYALGKLYTTRFYQLLKGALTTEGMAAVQSTSPLFARQSFWCIAATMEAAGLVVRPYHAFVPSFGVWGFMLASPRPFDVPTEPPAFATSLTPAVLRGMFDFPPDIARVPAEVNRLNNQALVHYYDEEWRRWN